MSMQTRLAKVTEKLGGTDLTPAQRVVLIQRRMDYIRALETDPAANLAELEAGFVTACMPFSQRHGISYAAWRSVGVPARVLRLAGWKEARAAGGRPRKAAQPTEAPEAAVEPQEPRKRQRGTTRTSPATVAV